MTFRPVPGLVHVGAKVSRLVHVDPDGIKLKLLSGRRREVIRNKENKV